MKVYEGSIRYIKAVRAAGLRTAVVSSSANTVDVLKAAAIADLFDVRIDGAVAQARHLAGKPAPDTFLAAAHDLGVPPAQAAVFETRSRASRPGAPGTLRVSSGWTGSGRPKSCLNTARTSS